MARRPKAGDGRVALQTGRHGGTRAGERPRAFRHWRLSPAGEAAGWHVRGSGVSSSPIEAARARHCLAEVARRCAMALSRASASVTVRRPFTSHCHLDAGLALIGRDARILDRFRGRVLLPIRDEDGGVCGFVGRHVGSGGDSAPKYLKLPRTALYDMSVHLYERLPLARTAQCPKVVVEGTLDTTAIAVAAIRSGRAGEVIPLTQSGRELPVRQLEHALGLGHGELALALALDGDVAGREATERLARAVLGRGRRALRARRPDGHDPASLLAEVGPTALDALLEGCAALPRSRRNASGSAPRSLAPPSLAPPSLAPPCSWSISPPPVRTPGRGGEL